MRIGYRQVGLSEDLLTIECVTGKLGIYLPGDLHESEPNESMR